MTKSTGGIALYHRALVTGLDPDRFAIHTLCLSDDAPAYAESLRAKGHTAEVLAMDRYRINPFGDLRVLQQATAAARRIGAKAVLCHGSKPGMIGRAVGWRLGIPAVYCQASLPFLPRIQGRRAPLYAGLERLARVFGGHIVCLTEDALRQTVDHGIASPDRVRVIRSGIDIARFKPSGDKARARQAFGLVSERPVVGWIGRFEPQKAPDVFVDAAARLLTSRPDVQIVMAGEGRLKDDIIAQLAALGLTDQIRLLPWQADPARLMEALDLFVLSSRWEGMPLVLLETMAMGCVPVSAAVDGCVEVVDHGVNGFLVTPDDPEAMAGAMIEALSDPARLRDLSFAARHKVESRFNEPMMLGEWESLLLELTKDATA